MTEPSNVDVSVLPMVNLRRNYGISSNEEWKRMKLPAFQIMVHFSKTELHSSYSVFLHLFATSVSFKYVIPKYLSKIRGYFNQETL